MRGYVEAQAGVGFLLDFSPDSELPDDLCPKCGGHGTPQTRPDRDGQYDPCDPCEGTGLRDFERDRPHA
jgi:DnaJ-class molecular chaperone